MKEILIEKLKEIETPAHIIDLNQIKDNFINNIDVIRKETNCKIFLALKGFSNDNVLAHFINKLDGVTATGLFETKLGKELNVKISTLSVAYKEDQIEEICKNSSYVIFNSMNQYNKYCKVAQKENCSIGIRINPEYTELPDTFGANTCKKDSHLGIRKIDMPPINNFEEGKIEGIHLHTMCEQEADALERTVNYLIENYDVYLKNIKWINLGGGQLISKKDYDINKAVNTIKKLQSKYEIEVILEPCEGIMFNSGYYVASVEDIIKNEMNLAVLDGSAVCHMPDCAYRGWTREVYNAICIEDMDDMARYNNVYKLAGCSCFAGDTFGIYAFNEDLKIGDKIIFRDTASYTMVKNNMFNGIPFPTLYLLDLDNQLNKCKEYDYECFKNIN